MNTNSVTILIICSLFVFFLCCQSEERRSSIPATSPVEAESMTQPMQEPTHPYEFLRQWKPNNELNGYGAEILLNRDYSEIEFVSLIQKLAERHDPVIIRIFTSRKAYDQEQADNYGPEYKSGYILFYVKNMTGRGAYRGFNEIRWMQEIGKFSPKFGLKTRL
jgi:hypothetical protein